MNNKLLLSVAFAASAFSGFAQQNKTTYAITGDGNNDFVWMNIRQVDLTTGQVTKTLFERNTTNYSLTDVSTNVTSTQREIPGGDVFNSAKYPTGTLVAAAAFDKRTNKLFFTPMRKGELRWMDLNSTVTAKFFTMPIPGYKPVEDFEEATNITRMVIGADGVGYALSNDGNHFFSFTTGAKPVIKSLGNIIDAETNTGISIHNKCSCWGGDMIADAFGNLYVISANHNVFMIDPKTRIATYKGNIQGLPATYTTNAAAVNDNGDVVLGSANQFDGFYVLNMSDLKAVKMEGSQVKYNPSDFANGNMLFQKQADNLANGSVVPSAVSSSNSKVFPNPVTNASFNILFDNNAGKHSIIVSDLAGRVVYTNQAFIAEGKQNQRINLKSNTPKGVYIVKVMNDKNQIVVNEKIVVQ
jgi:hypothetical protein